MIQTIFKSVILGTAGHIDHGKSSLVKALTGIDPDRLKEEKERGITIDLGFANLLYPDGVNVGIVDVPGHEKLIKNMLAGSHGIDILLMVIAADEGIMLQSREHLAICELLKIKTGIIVITKTDNVDKEWIELISDDIRKFTKGTFLEQSDIIAVSSKTNFNLDKLKEKIYNIALKVKPKMVQGIFRLPIDRIFTLKGFGTVVTGTVISGTLSVDEPVEILPTGIVSKIRGLQCHNKSVSKAFAGQRIGINLQGVEKTSIKRGDVVVPFKKFITTKSVDAKLDVLQNIPTIKTHSLIHFYSGTSETVARIILYDKVEIRGGESCYCQFRLEDPIVTLSGDKYIIRRLSPLETMGGGSILDPHPLKRKKKTPLTDLISFEQGGIDEKMEILVKRSFFKGCPISTIEGWLQAGLPEIKTMIDKLCNEKIFIKCNEILFHIEIFKRFKELLINILSNFHKAHPLKSGVLKEDIKVKIKIEGKGYDNIFDTIYLIDDITVEKDTMWLRSFDVSMDITSKETTNKIIDILNKEKFQPTLKSDLSLKLNKSEKEIEDLLKLLVKNDLLIRINDNFYITKDIYNNMINLLKDFSTKKNTMTVAEFRDILGTSRKFALPLLEYLDSNKITLRVDDIRKILLK